MANSGKYIDRNPDIKAAGKWMEPVENVGDTLKIYSPGEAAFNIMNFKCKKEQQKMLETASLGYSQFLPPESIKDLLSPELKKSRFVAFKEKFSEDMYFKKAELGQALALESKPADFTNENFTYGSKYNMSEKAYDVICPNKPPYQVKREFLKWHDKYLVSHKKYLPSEKVKRNYNDNFNPHATYGISSNVDLTGLRVKKCLEQCDRLVVINKFQKKFIDRTTGQLGKKIDRYNLNLDPKQIFGIKTKNQTEFDVRALIENEAPCKKKNEIIEAISHINNLRRVLFNRSDFHMYDLKIMLNKYEDNGTGLITLNSIMRVLRSLQVYASQQKLRIGMLHFEMLKDENKTSELVSIDEFWKMLHMQYPLKRKIITSALNKDYENKETTYRLLCSDREKTIVPQKMPRQKNIDDCITTGDLIAPDIPMNYGLLPSDFVVLRSKEELKLIFQQILPQNFDEVWNFAWMNSVYDEDSCKMSINEFRDVIDEFNKQNLKS